VKIVLNRKWQQVSRGEIFFRKQLLEPVDRKTRRPDDREKPLKYDDDDVYNF